MKRLCIFAHWDKDNIIDDYVIYYLKALKEVCQILILVSDSDLSQFEKDKLSGISDYVIAKKHGEYDFGSYKRGFSLSKEYSLEYDELVFANDSCYGPFCSLKPIFDKMESKKCDWWGMTKNYLGIIKKGKNFYESYEPHIQSYFLVFKKNVFNSPAFSSFMEKITRIEEKNDIIINYEIGLSKLLKKQGLIGKVYYNEMVHSPNPMLNKWDKMLRRGFPFLKTCFAVDLDSRYSTYPVELIINHKKRVQSRIDYKSQNLLMRILPAELYICCKFFDRKILSTFRRMFRNKI